MALSGRVLNLSLNSASSGTVFLNVRGKGFIYDYRLWAGDAGISEYMRVKIDGLDVKITNNIVLNLPFNESLVIEITQPTTGKVSVDAKYIIEV